MKLSIVIVNYNVKFFLQQCLSSVYNALKNIEAEVWVVDNNSVDDSVEMVKKLFPKVILIENKTNFGFSKANNQAIEQSSGEYVLLLNPDTIVEESTLSKVLEFMDSHSNAGGLGVKMIDGKGKFLPESKRGLPTPEVAFYKMLGLTKLFPKSKRFAHYYLGHLDKDKTHKVEILSGAFMLLRKNILDKIGLLDDTFFMYGEDIDLSYRILLAGYDNYYFADTKIIHYKGESTKKGSLNYVYMFYNAMLIFAKKHFAQKKTAILMISIKLAIFFRALLSVFKRFVSKIYIPLLDALAIFASYYFIIPWWQKVYFHDFVKYPEFIWLQIAAYITIWLISSFFAGSYDKPVKASGIFSGIAAGTVIILIVYALLPLDFRFSRALILIGAVITVAWMFVFRFILAVLKKYTHLEFYTKKYRKIFIVGNFDEANRVKNVLNQINLNIDILGFISPNEHKNGYIGILDRIEEIITIYKPDEIIFCSKDLSTEDIISKMLILSSYNINVKIAPKDSISIIGSNSINTAGDLYTLDLNTITKPQNRRIKRLFDVFISFSFLLLYIFIFWFVENKINFLANIFKVFSGKRTWVGFYTDMESEYSKLPNIKKGIVSSIDILPENKNINEELIRNINVSYAKNYGINKDFYILIKSIKKLGKK